MIVALAISLMVIGICFWFDRNRQTESFDVSFPSSELSERREGIEGEWKQTHQDVEKAYFAYYVSRGKVLTVIVNYYK